MKYSLIFILFSIFSLSSFAQNFKSGNEFTATPLYGTVHMTCFGNGTQPTKSVVYQCQDLRLFPVEYDFFLGPQGVEADTLELTSIRESGSSTNKKVSYKDGSSVNRVNLWIRSLFQDPLLGKGMNQVEYNLKLNGQSVSQGKINVLVKQGQSVNCPTENLIGNLYSDCDTPYTACQNYFSHNNFCR